MHRIFRSLLAAAASATALAGLAAPIPIIRDPGLPPAQQEAAGLGGSSVYPFSSANGKAAAIDTDNDGIPDSVEPTVTRNACLKDNDVFTIARLFAMQQYRDFLDIEGDTAGVNAWTQAIAGGTQTRVQVLGSFFDSAQFQNGLPQITRLYFAFFGRVPDYPGLQFHVSRFRAGVPLTVIGQDFAMSQEFLNAYGALTNAQYIDTVYANVLNRPADAPGRAFWLNQLDSGAMTRGGVMVAFSESTENLNITGPKTFVVLVYVGMLRRSPDPAGFENWVNAIATGTPRSTMFSAFLGSAEYHNRFLP